LAETYLLLRKHHVVHLVTGALFPLTAHITNIKLLHHTP